MKKLLRIYEPYQETLEKSGIDAIYYNNDFEWIVEFSGAGYATIYGDDLSDEEIEDIKERVARNDGEDMDTEEIETLKVNIDFDFNF